MFVDETKRQNYVLACAAFAPDNMARAREGVRGLLAPGQRFLHMKSETRRASSILDGILSLNPRPTLYICRREPGATQVMQRCHCLAALARDSAANGVRSLTLDDADDAEKRRDRQVIAPIAHVLFAYEHRPSRMEPLLWVPDVLAWCHQRGGRLREAVVAVATIVDL